jgi:predicted ATPase
MITKIEVDGFKSLSNFKMTLNPGLNVLVGPNGTGKTNIVSFFEFLAHVIESGPAEATSYLGGAGAILRRVKNSHLPLISARVIGSYQLNQNVQLHNPEQGEKQVKFALYDYGFTLQYLGSLEPVVFAKQHLRFKYGKNFIEHKNIESECNDWDVEIEMSLNSQEMKPVIKVKKSKGNLRLFLPIFPPEVKDTDLVPSIEQFLGNICSANVSLPTAISRFSPLMHSLSGDLAGGQAYNIIPSRVRLPEDSARPPGIASDGSGLATTLYSLKRTMPANPNFHFWQMAGPGRQQALKTPSLEILKNYFQLANKSISEVLINVDPFNNQVQVSFEVKNGEYTAQMPLSLMSDGTLKWITLLTAALTASSIFSIEEPENYLHPNMQAQCVNILREILFQEHKHACILMTTHSETLLNNCKPSELIIVNQNDGQTIAYRCQNEAEVSDEIAKTGFGLGYYYINNALQND